MIGLYALETNLEVAAFADGLRAASLPFKYRNHNHFTKDQTEAFDAVVVSGLRAQGKDILEAYSALNIPVIVIDYGYMDRVFGVGTWSTGHWQLGLNRLGWVPPFKCPSDRFDALNITLKSPRDGEVIIVCGQHAGDPSHGMDSKGISDWATKAIQEMKVYGMPVLWRPHPDSPDVKATGHDGLSRGEMDWSKVHAIRCINSNIGHEAIIEGVKVYADDTAPYAGIEDRYEYFCRLAYAQWTLDEMRSGEAIEFIFKTIKETK